MNDLIPQFIDDGTVYQKEGCSFIDSRRVAEIFGKRHADVLRAIDDLVEQGAPERSFTFSFYVSELSANPGQKYRMCEMDRKGFMLLAMGFTGAEALQWKVKLIDAFDYLEARVRELESQPQFTIPKTLGDALRLAGELSDRAEKAEQEATRLQIVAAAMKPDAEAFVRLASTPGSFKASIVAKALKMPVKEFYRWLREDLKWVFYETHHGTPRNIPYATVEKKGHATVDMAKAKIRGQEVSIPVLRITALGASVLAKKRNIYDSDMKERLKIATSSQGQLELNEAGNE